MSNAKNLLTNPRILILLVFIVLALYFIRPNPFNSGVVIHSIEKDSPASIAGLKSPTEGKTSNEKIMSVYIGDKKKDNVTVSGAMDIGSGSFGRRTPSKKFGRKQYYAGNPIKSIDDYYSVTANISADKQVIIFTNKGKYNLDIANTSTTEDLGLTVSNAPTSNLQKGLDLAGGTRVLLQPERKLDELELELVLDVLERRLNVFGLADVNIREAKDLSGDQFILIEIAGVTEREIREIVSREGKFEAKIGDETVFTGGNDINYVCRDYRCSGINMRRGCNIDEEGITHCSFFFSITLSLEAAQRQADITRDLEVINNGSYNYLSKTLELYLDDELIDDLNIGVGLKGNAVTQIQISGSGSGVTRQAAMDDALENMKTLQTVLQSGSLPVKMDIVKTDSLSPLMGEKFSTNAVEVALLALASVAAIVFIRYRKLKVALPMIASILCEVIIILGVAAVIKWNLDLVAIAGIIVAVGTGVDDLIVLTDEALSNESQSWTLKKKNAFFVIMAAYFTTVVAMLPLMFAGAGLLRGFAVTTILGITAGVFVVRPAYAVVLKMYFQKEVS